MTIVIAVIAVWIGLSIPVGLVAARFISVGTAGPTGGSSSNPALARHQSMVPARGH